MQTVHYRVHFFTCFVARECECFSFVCPSCGGPSAVSVVGRLLFRWMMMAGIHPLPTPPTTFLHSIATNPAFSLPFASYQDFPDAYHPHQTPYADPRPLLWPIIPVNNHKSVCANPRKGPLHFSPPPAATYPCHSHIGTVEAMEARS